MNSVVVADIDGTMCVSSRHVPDAADHAVVDEWPGGASLTTWAGFAAWSRLAGVDALVPATARRVDQLQRMRWPGPRPSLAIALNGGVILEHGQPIEQWTQAVLRRSRRSGWDRAHAERLLQEHLGASTRLIDSSPGVFAHAVCQTPPPPDLIARMRPRAEEAGWILSAQGRKVYLTPEASGKAEAVEWLVRHRGLRVVAAAGDSELDLPMLRAAPAASCPAGSEARDRCDEPSWYSPVGAPVEQVGLTTVWLAEQYVSATAAARA